jgi:type IV secretory pathway VirB9-like protein
MARESASNIQEDLDARFAEINAARIEASIMPGAGVPADQLDFSAIAMTGAARWKPTRIYSATGKKTYIQFPTALVRPGRTSTVR